jgi:phosphatidylglycerol:prolipoprotein diacylglycerol transferase
VFKKISVLAVLDIVSLGFMIGQMLGRWGNFFNREAHGGITDSFLRMGLLNPVTGEGNYYHPTFLYESLWNLMGFVLLHFFSKKRKYDGQVALCYVAWYGLGRTFIEGLRTDSLWWGNFRVSQVLAAASCVIAVVLLIFLAFRPHDPQDLFVNKVAAKKAAEEAEEENTEE